MGNIRIERVPIQEMGLWRIRADHLMLVFQQDPLDYSEFQDRWWVMEGTRDVNPDGTVTLGVEGSDGVTTISAANGGLSPKEVLDTLKYPWWRGSRIIQSTDPLSDWGFMAAVARDIEDQLYPYYAFNFEFSSLPIANSSSVVASLLFYIGVDIAENMPSMFLTYTVGTETILGTSDDDPIKLVSSFDTIIAGEGNDKLEGTQSFSQREKLYGGRDNDTFIWTEGSHVYHGGQPGLDYAADGHDLIDYTGVEAIHFRKAILPIPHLRPDYIAVHATGMDKLFSIESVGWNDSSDYVTLGEGVLFKNAFFDMRGEEKENGGDLLDFSERTSSLLLAPSNRPDIVFAGLDAEDGTFSDAEGLWVQSLERLIGSASDDRIYASSTMTSVDGSAGSDTVSGRLATPLTGASPSRYDIELSGGLGNDTIISGSGRSLALGGAGADTFVLGATSDGVRNVEFVIGDADVSDRLFVPYNFLLPDAGAFEGSKLFPILGAVTPVIGGAAFAMLPQNAGPGPFNGTAAPGYFYLIGQVPLDDTVDDVGGEIANITNQILFNRDGADLLIHIYSGSFAFDPMFLTLDGQDFTYQEYDFEFATEAVVRVRNFQEGMLGITFYELGEELPFPFPAGSGTPNAAKLWDRAQFAQAGGAALREALQPEPAAPVFDRPDEGETDTRDLIAGGESDDILALPNVASAGFSSGADIKGFGGNDQLTGGAGQDTLDGGSGNDIMSGGKGNDRYFVDSPDDVVIEVWNSGVDSVFSSVAFVLPNYVENLTLTGSATFGQGNAAANLLTGSRNGDVLNGLDGDDILFGGRGDDVLDGGRGNDGYVYSAGDGVDIILPDSDEAGYDVLQISGFAPADVRIYQSSDLSDVILRFADGGRIILDSFFGGRSIDAIGFDDETIWDAAFMTAAAVQSGPLLNDAPIAAADFGFFTYGQSAVIPKAQLLANDRDMDGDLLTIINVATTTAGAEVTLTAGGDVGVLAPTGYSGLVSITYTVSDGRGGQATAAAEITFDANTAPEPTGVTLSDARISPGQTFSYTLPADAFSDADGDALIYSADLSTGSPLPSWLRFNAATREFSGTPPRGFIGDLDIRVTASDGISAASLAFVLSVEYAPAGLVLAGTPRSDILTGDEGDDEIIGGRGNDILSGLGGDDVFYVKGNAGFDSYDGGAGFDLILGDSGNDTIGIARDLLTGIEEIDGGDGFDVLRFDHTANTIDLSDVTLIGIEQILAGAGADRITGSSGDDVIVGGTGSDILAGGAGNDTFLIIGRQGRDTFDGGEGFDRIAGSAGNDELFLEGGSLHLVSIEAIDLGDGFDVLRTGAGADVIDLSAILVSGLERIDAGTGNDLIIGSAASEILAGGAGQDIFVFRDNFGHDTIADFQLRLSPRRNGDVIDVTSLGFGSLAAVLAHTFQDGFNSIIRTPNSESSITLLNIAVSELQADDFLV